MVFAKTSKAASRLSEQVRNKSFKKTYRAVIHGKMNKQEDNLMDYLYKNINGREIYLTFLEPIKNIYEKAYIKKHMKISMRISFDRWDV